MSFGATAFNCLGYTVYASGDGMSRLNLEAMEQDGIDNYRLANVSVILLKTRNKTIRSHGEVYNLQIN